MILPLWRLGRLRRRLWLVGLSALVALLLTACGAAGSRAGGGSTHGTPAATRPTGAGMTIRPCLGTYTGGVTPTLTLTNTASQMTGSAHVGGTIELVMDAHHSWRLTGVTPLGALTSTSREGQFDSARSACVWVFHAISPGDATIAFTGMALCDPTQVCPQYAILARFTLHIS